MLLDVKESLNSNEIHMAMSIVLKSFGFSPDVVLDYDKVYAPITRYNYIQSIVAIVNDLNSDIHQIDTKPIS